jgi:hypothetical protein
MACCCWWISLTHQCCLVIASELCPNPMVDHVPNIIPSALLHSSPCCVSAIPFPGFGTRCLGNPVFSLRLGSIVKTRYKDRVFVADSSGYTEVSLQRDVAHSKINPCGASRCVLKKEGILVSGILIASFYCKCSHDSDTEVRRCCRHRSYISTNTDPSWSQCAATSSSDSSCCSFLRSLQDQMAVLATSLVNPNID